MTANSKIFAIVDYEDDYVQPLLLAALKRHIPDIILLNKTDPAPDAGSNFLQWRQYESIDFDKLLERPTHCLANSFVIRKALIRKHYLSNTVSHWLSKNPGSDLRRHVQPSIQFELDYAEFLDDAILEAYELHESWARNATAGLGRKEWWILKPGMSDRGQGIRLFSSEEELTAIFEEWDPPSDDDDDEAEAYDNEEEELATLAALTDDIMTSQLRHFVVQPYIDPPLLLSSHVSEGRKFHIRTYVVAVGALKVYVYTPMLALFAGKKYLPPDATNNEDLEAHLTNTCLQDTGERDGAVHEFWSLPFSLESLPGSIRSTWQQHVWDQISRTTATIFEAAARTSSIHFQPLPNAFEIYGLDYLVDAEGCAWLLEVNAFPDFAQTGAELHVIIKELMSSVVATAVLPFFHLPRQSNIPNDLVEVLDLDLGRR